MGVARVVPAVALVLCVGQAAAGPINIPSNTWVAFPSAAEVGGTYYGRCTNGGCKHIRVTFDPVNNLSYWEGGDDNYGSSDQEMWTLEVQNDSLVWRLEQPFCVPAGQVQPGGPDEVGFSYDTKRNIFWMIPGYMNIPGYSWCDPSQEYKYVTMTYDPATHTWALANMSAWDALATTGATGGNQKWTQYDPVTDTIIAFTTGLAHIYHPSDGTVETVQFTTDSNGVDVSQAAFGWTYSAVDYVARVIYLLDPYKSKFYRYYMDTRELRYLGPLPTTIAQGVYGNQDQMVLWDSVSRVVLWNYRPVPNPDGSQPPVQLYVYHPDTSQWEYRPLTPAVDLHGNVVLDGSGNPVNIQGRCGVYDPSANAMIFTGNDGPTVPYVFLYRYASASGDSIPPSAPGNLHTR